ncbi:unnamed protein product [Cylindrotheca closterium]|uniref:VWFD domain-containing protein n=1 Tax=Cylindrotheca closterium TaxID=2856 RepID=A0AAD2CEC8_9STRA|nr:unnamed protein product [Cylindrotheca closterium]
MKLTLSLTAIAAFGPTLVRAADIGMCSAQAMCIDFTVKKTSECFGEDCGIQVCMILDTEKEGCPKEENISHLCSASSGGCAAYDSDGVTPLTGKGTSSDCTSTTFDGKCEPEEYGGQRRIKMCQEGKPGEKLYWALKDADVADTGSYDYTGVFPFDNDDTTCSPTVKCLGDGHSLECATPNSDMSSSTRVWEYTIPADDGTACDMCTGPTPDPPLSTLPPTPSPPPGSNIQPTPGGNGDPHFRTWKDEHFEFHGQCDIVMTNVKDFANQSIDLDIHLRTSMVRHWSYIKAASIRIGNDILEIQGSAAKEDGEEKRHHWINFEYRGDITDVGGFPVTISPRNNKYMIDLDSVYPGQKIEIMTYKEFVGVKMIGATEESFGSATGIIGDFKTGKTYARDGVTELSDFNELGMEWQVLPSDGKLFHELARPQFPERCYLPEDPRGERARRLDESSISEEQAEAACAGLEDKLSRKDCLYDILATQDLDMVGAY